MRRFSFVRVFILVGRLGVLGGASRLLSRPESEMSDKSANSNAPARSNPAVESPEERLVSIAKLRDMSRDERLALLMRNFSVDCAEVGGRPRRGAAAPRKAPAIFRESGQDSLSTTKASDAGPRSGPRGRPGA